MANLPPLEQDVILVDHTSDGFDRINRSSQQLNRTLQQTDQAIRQVEQAQVGLRSSAPTGGSIFNTDAFNNINTGPLDDLIAKQDTLQTNLNALGQADLSDMTRKFGDVRDTVDRLTSGLGDAKGVTTAVAKEATGLSDAMVAISRSPISRALVPQEALATIRGIAQIVPGISNGLLVSAGAVGALALGAKVAYDAFQRTTEQVRALEIKNNYAGLVSKTFQEPAKQAIDQFQTALQDGLSEKEALNILVKVDSEGALQDMQKLGQVAQTVREYAFAFGGDWKTALAQVVEAVQGNNGAMLENLGIIRDAGRAYQEYASSVGKLPQQLTGQENQQALIQGILSQNAELVNQQDSASEKLVKSGERFKTAFADAGAGFSEFALALLDPSYSSMAEFWAEKLDYLASAVIRVNESLSARTAEFRFAEQIPADEQAKLQAIYGQVAYLRASIDNNNAQLPILASEGQQDSISKIETVNQQFSRQIEEYEQAIAEAKKNFQQGLEVNLPDANAGLPPDQLAAIKKVTDPTPADVIEGIQDRQQLAGEITRLQEEQIDLQQKLQDELFKTQGQIDADYVQSLKDQLVAYDQKIAAMQLALDQFSQSAGTAQAFEPPTVTSPPSPDNTRFFAGFNETQTSGAAIAQQKQKEYVDVQRESTETSIALQTTYADAVSQANEQLTAANDKLAESWFNLLELQQQAAKSSPAIEAGLHAEESAIQDQIAAIAQKQQKTDLLLQRQEVVQRQGGFQTNVEQAKRQVDELGTYIDSASRYTQLQQALANNSDEIYKQIAQSGKGYSSSLDTERKELQTQAEQAQGDALLAFARLAAEGVDIAGSTGEEKLSNASRALEEAQNRLSYYRQELEGVNQEVADIQEPLDRLGASPIDLSVDTTGLQQIQASLAQQRIDLDASLADVQAKIANLQSVPADVLDEAQRQTDAANAAQLAAEAKANLTLAERNFVEALQAVRLAAVSGDQALLRQAESEGKVAQSAYLMALQQAQAVEAVTDLAVAAEGLPRSLDTVIGAVTKVRDTGGSILEEFAANALTTLTKTKTEIDNLEIKTPVIQGPEQNPHAYQGPASIPSDTTQEVKQNAATQAEAADTVGKAWNSFWTAFSAGSSATTQVAQDFVGLSGVMLQDAAAAGEAAVSHDEAAAAVDNHGVAVASAAGAYTVFLPLVNASSEAIQKNAYESLQAAAEQGRLIAQLDATTQVAGVTVDAISGLPVAFDLATTSSSQLEGQVAQLSAELDGLQYSAQNAGLAISQRLVPVLGIGGAVRQGLEFAQQAQGLRQTFDQRNEQLLAGGQSPLSPAVLEAGLGALQQRQSALVADVWNEFSSQGQSAVGGMKNSVDKLDQALDSLIGGLLQDTTKGLIPLDEILPREDAIDENARRMADVAVKGFKSPWYEGLKDLFPDDVLQEGEDKVKQHAAKLVQDHQKGLTTIFYDTDLAAQKALERIQAKGNQDDLIAQVREKVKGLAQVSDLDIADALGIDTTADRIGAAVGKSVKDSTANLFPSYEELVKQIFGQGDTNDPNADPLGDELSKQADAGAEKKEGVVVKQGKGLAQQLGDAMVGQAGEGDYGNRAIDAMIAKISEKEESVKGAGKTVGHWMGGALVNEFRENVPGELLAILVTELVPLMKEAQAADKERESASGGGPS